MSIRFPGSAKTTSPLGFGCAHLVAGHRKANSLRQVQEAYDCGYRHFDVAPAYGIGTAEWILGQGLVGKRHDVTLATKVGIRPPRLGPVLLGAHDALHWLRTTVPDLTHEMGQKVYSISVPRARFSVAEVRRSLIRSLRALRTDYLDLLLLHEVAPEDITDELLRFLELEKRNGTVLAVGTATSVDNTRRIGETRGLRFDVQQFSWNVLDRYIPMPVVSYKITHRSIRGALDDLSTWLAQDAAAAKRLSEATETDLCDELELSKVLIGAAIAFNPTGITLVSSRRLDRIRANAEVLLDCGLVRLGGRLVGALKKEAAELSSSFVRNRS